MGVNAVRELVLSIINGINLCVEGSSTRGFVLEGR